MIANKKPNSAPINAPQPYNHALVIIASPVLVRCHSSSYLHTQKLFGAFAILTISFKMNIFNILWDIFELGWGK